MPEHEHDICDAFSERLSRLDVSLFERIPSQTSENDRRSLLALQEAVRARGSSYAYLEIGSHLGGTIQPFLPDDRCTHVFSIDRRPLSQPDERGPDYDYPDNSTAHMLALLRELSPGGAAKVRSWDADARDVDPAAVVPTPALCFVDGEHTDRAVKSDAAFCLKVLAGSGVLAFHDAPVVYNGLYELIEDVGRAGTPFVAYHLPDTVFVIEIGDFPIHRSPAVARMLVQNYTGYLASLRANDHYRRFYNRPAFRVLRRIKTALRRIFRGIPAPTALAPCPVCGAATARGWGTRGGYRLLRCTRCTHRFADVCGAELTCGDPAGFLMRLTHGLVSTDRAYYEHLTLGEKPGQASFQTAELIFGNPVLLGRAPGRWLDVGSGSGYLVRRARDRGWDAVGVEPGGWGQIAAEEKGIRVVQGFLRANTLDHPFDAISATDVLEHQPAPLEMLALIRGYLAPDGRVFISIPFADSFRARILGARWEMVTPPTHCQFFTRRSLEAAADRCGLELVRLTQYGVSGAATTGLIRQFAVGLATRVGGGGDQALAVLRRAGRRG
jgi:SAM-dependent methyltransferase